MGCVRCVVVNYMSMLILKILSSGSPCLGFTCPSLENCQDIPVTTRVVCSAYGAFDVT